MIKLSRPLDYLIKIIIAVLSVVFILGVFELVFIVKHTIADRAISDEKKEFLREVYRTTEDSAIDQEYYPYVLWRAKPNQTTEVFKTNSIGLRDKEIGLSKPENEYRILFAGGSAAWGYGATTNEKTIPAQLELMLNKKMPNRKFRVINFGQVAYVSGQELILWHEFIDWKPDLVIHFNGHNDVYSGFKGIEPGGINPFGREYIFSMDRGKIILKLIFDSLSEFVESLYLYRSIKFHLGFNKKTEVNFSNIETVADVYTKNMNIVSDIANAEKIKVLIITQPTLSTEKKILSEQEKELLNIFERPYSPQGAPSDYYRRSYELMNKNLAELVRLKNIWYIDGSTFFENISDTLYFDHVHFGDTGNAIIAGKLADYITNRLNN